MMQRQYGGTNRMPSRRRDGRGPMIKPLTTQSDFRLLSIEEDVRWSSRRLSSLSWGRSGCSGGGDGEARAASIKRGQANRRGGNGDAPLKYPIR
jgi:hypothetical protein